MDLARSWSRRVAHGANRVAHFVELVMITLSELSLQ
jgi:hypothetical protein